MLRITPVTYFVDGLIATGVAGAPVICPATEFVSFDPPPGQNCGTYLASYLSYAGGYLLNPTAGQDCQFCPVADMNGLLGALGIDYADRWRDWVSRLFLL